MNNKLDKLLRSARPPLPLAPKNSLEQIIQKELGKKSYFKENLKKLFLIPAFATIVLFLYVQTDTETLISDDEISFSYEIDYDEWDDYNELLAEI